MILTWDRSSTPFSSGTSQHLLAQVVYLPDKQMHYQCHVYLNKEVVPIVMHSFATHFASKMKSFLMFLQGYTQASRHPPPPSGTVIPRRGISPTFRREVVKYFPYDLCPIELDDHLTAQLTNNPTFLIQGFSGMQSLIQQAMQDQDLSYDNFGSTGKNNRDQSKGYGKSKGKSKSKRL